MHVFPVVGMSKKADVNNPETWGRNAVIADAWANVHEPAKIGLAYLKEFFGFNAKKEYIVFEDIDRLKKLFSKMLKSNEDF